AGWPALEARIADLRAGAVTPRIPATATGAPGSPTDRPPQPERAPSPRPSAPEPPATPGRPAERGEARTDGASATSGPSASDAEAARFTVAEPRPSGLAYDAVSRRFVVASREARKLSAVDEFTRHVATLSGTQA